MKKISETVVFFGSGPVAAKSLELLAKRLTIEAVITKPKPSHHKGSFPVLDVAKKLHLPTLTVTNRQSLDDLVASNTFTSRAGVLVDFGIIVSRSAIDCFQLGIVNSHFSLLPEWRGADPITFAILSGQKQTGVSLMLLVEKMDEGPLLTFGVQDIASDMTAPELTEQLILLSDGLLRVEIPRYLSGKTKLTSQEKVGQLLANYPTQPTYSHKLTKDDGLIDWNKPAEQIEREIRAYIEWPKSRTRLAGRDVIVTKAHVVPNQPPDTKPSDVEVVKQAGAIMVTTGAGSLCIDRLKPAGKAEMSATAFIAGYGKYLEA